MSLLMKPFWLPHAHPTATAFDFHVKVPPLPCFHPWGWDGSHTSLKWCLWMGLEVLVELQPLGHNLPLIRVMGPGACQWPELLSGWVAGLLQVVPKRCFCSPRDHRALGIRTCSQTVTVRRPGGMLGRQLGTSAEKNQDSGHTDSSVAT